MVQMMARTKKRPSRLLSGTPLLGFAQAFDSVHGDENTPWPYKVVIPSAVGSALLPFNCPYCNTVCNELVDPSKRTHYYDKLRKFSWCPCPDCRKRFFVDRKGMPLVKALPAGATVAPSKVEEGEGTLNKPSDVIDVKALLATDESQGLDMLGSL